MLSYPLRNHLDHSWEKVGRCVYCSCGTRLYQGDVPRSREAKESFVDALDKVLDAALSTQEQAEQE